MFLIVVIGAGSAASPTTDRDSLWSFAPIRRPSVPQLGDRCENPIDRFVIRELREQGSHLAPEADRRTLIRRLTFDLIGLPPTPEETATFLADRRPDAYEGLVNRLLSSPHYGERWGRHWLDVVRFAETHGYERDHPKPNAWRYRDWVIDAFNRDLPYDRFLTEQLAGDEVPDATNESRLATGVFRLGLIDDEPADPVMDRYDQLDDMVKVVGSGMLGLTLHCARCHDHKFDPITQADYYRTLAFFTPSRLYHRDPKVGKTNVDTELEFVLASPEEKAAHADRNSELDRQIAELKARVEALRAPYRAQIRVERERLLDRQALAALQTPVEQRTDEQKRLADAAAPALTIKPEDVDARLAPAHKDEKERLEGEIKARGAERPPPLPRGLWLTDRGTSVDPTTLMIRGDAHRPGAEVAPGFLAAIDPNPPLITPPSGAKTTGRRLALAKWITRPDNPLTARVIVNRLWQHHFGQGLVATPSDFGHMGEEPSNPALLDWLASELIARGWRIKPMHRLMVTSRIYKQATRRNETLGEADPGNRPLWRAVPRRLEAEPVRDAVLAVSGQLNRAIGGPSVRPPIDKAVLAGQSRPGDGWEVSDPMAWPRRSVYVYVKRTLPLPELAVMDAADTNDTCPSRAVTTTAPQALTWINGAFMAEQAGHFADRLRRESGDAPALQVDRGFALALNRAPTDAERSSSLEFLDAQVRRIGQRPRPEDRSDVRREALRAFCLALLNTNEFVTVD